MTTPVAPQDEPAPRPALPGWLRVIAYLVAWVPLTVVLVLFSGLIAIPLVRDVPDDLADLARAWPVLAIAYTIVLLGSLLLTAAFWLGVDRRPWREFGFHPPRSALLETSLGLALGAATVLAAVLLGMLAGWYRVRPAAGGPEALKIMGAALLVLLPAAALEEVVLRGYIFQTLARDYGWLVGAVVSSLLFGLLHLPNPNAGAAGFAGVVFAGLYFAAAFRLSGRLYLPIAAHLTWNWLLGPFFGLPVSGLELPSVLRTSVSGPDWATGGAFGPEAGALSWIALAASFPLLLFATRHLPGRRSTAGSPDGAGLVSPVDPVS